MTAKKIQPRRLITELTFRGESRMQRLVREAHAVVMATKLARYRSMEYGTANHANKRAYDLAVSLELDKRLAAAGIAVERQTRRPKSQLPPPKPVAKGNAHERPLHATLPAISSNHGPAPKRRSARLGYELVRVAMRSSPFAPTLDRSEAQEAHGDLDDAEYLGCDGTFHLWERREVA